MPDGHCISLEGGSRTKMQHKGFLLESQDFVKEKRSGLGATSMQNQASRNGSS